MVAEQIKRGLMTAENARDHPERSILLRNLGHELIVSVAKISIPLLQGDRVIVCSDGLYNVLRDREIERLSRGLDAVPPVGRWSVRLISAAPTTTLPARYSG